MTTLRTAAQQALEAMESADFDPHSSDAIYKAITALRAALVEPASMPPFPPVSQWKRGCVVCGIGADGKAYGYVCPRHDCPTKVTCGSA